MFNLTDKETIKMVRHLYRIIRCLQVSHGAFPIKWKYKPTLGWNPYGLKFKNDDIFCWCLTEVILNPSFPFVCQSQLKDDPKFEEFLDTHKNVSVKPVWTNDATQSGKATKNMPVVNKDVSGLPFDDDSDDDSDDDNDISEQVEVANKTSEKDEGKSWNQM